MPSHGVLNIDGVSVVSSPFQDGADCSSDKHCRTRLV